MTARTDGPPTVVCVPGTLCTPALFRPMARCVAGRARMAAVSWMTWPGPWDIGAVAGRVLGTVEHRVGGPVVLAGHSTGGAIVLQAALLRPDLVSGVLVMNSGANTAGHGDIDALLATFRRSAWRGWRAVGGTRSFATPPPLTTRLAMNRYALRVDKNAVIEVLTSQRDLDLSGRLSEVRCPVTVLHGVLDRARTPAHARQIADGVPDGQARWARTGHTVLVEDPPAAADALLGLLDRIRG